MPNMGGCYSSAGEGGQIYSKCKLSKESQFKQNGNLVKTGNLLYSNEVQEDKLSDGTFSGQKKKETKHSDSGIGSLGSSTEKEELPFEEKYYEVSDQQKFLRDNEISCEACSTDTLEKLSEIQASLTDSTYCSCGPQQTTWQRRKPNACVTHSPKVNRNSDIGELKSSLKKLSVKQPHKQNHLSWKSSDSLDYVATMYTSMDRAKSEASEIFCDDISFHAPLAAFDSVDEQLETNVIDTKHKSSLCRINLESEIENVADSICRCELSASDFMKSLEKDPVVRKDSVKTDKNKNESFTSDKSVSTECITKKKFSDNNDSFVFQQRNYKRCSTNLRDEHHDSQCDIVCNRMDNDILDYKKKPGNISTRHFYTENGKHLQFMSLPPRENMTTMVVDGCEMVLVDVDVYDQVMNGLAQIRQNLSQLTTVLQENENVHLNLNWDENVIHQQWMFGSDDR